MGHVLYRIGGQEDSDVIDVRLTRDSNGNVQLVAKKGLCSPNVVLATLTGDGTLLIQGYRSEIYKQDLMKLGLQCTSGKNFANEPCLYVTNRVI